MDEEKIRKEAENLEHLGCGCSGFSLLMLIILVLLFALLFG